MYGIEGKEDKEKENKDGNEGSLCSSPAYVGLVYTQTKNICYLMSYVYKLLESDECIPK